MLFDLLSRRDSLFSQSDHDWLFQLQFSPDGHWVTFGAVRQGRSRLFIPALRDTMTVAPESEWITLTGDERWADKPRWSPDGNLISFVSNRDGFFCLWAQPVARNTKRPTRGLVSIAHFHGSLLSIGNVGFSVLGISVAPDKIAFNLGGITGNIWVTNLSH